MVGDAPRPLFAFGDPQAPLAKLRAVLARAGLLVDAPGGPRVWSGARVLSIGDHFDWGRPADRDFAARDAEALLSWLAGHEDDNVILLAGNHDLARVGELLPFEDDEHFARVQQIADAHYHDGGDHDDEAAFFRACAWLPSSELVARDLSTFRLSQRALVEALLRRRRLRLAHAERGLLFTHAGVTRKALLRLDLDEPLVSGGGDPAQAAGEIARRLNAALDVAVDRCLGPEGTPRLSQRPLMIPGLHRPADSIGEGDGVLYHRPTHVDGDDWLEPRRFDPRRLPRGLWQVVGHVRDKRCIDALKGWSQPRQPVNGVLRHLVAHGGHVTYRHGLPPPRSSLPDDAAVMIFIDGSLHDASVDAYELLDVATLSAR